MSRLCLWAPAVLLASCVFLGGVRSVAGAGLEEAVTKARRSGMPLFVVGSGENCPHCKTLKSRLESEDELKDLLKKYVPLTIDVEDPEYLVWSSLFKPSSNGIPIIFIVTSKGEQIYNRSGVPQGEELKKLLLMGIEKNGRKESP